VQNVVPERKLRCRNPRYEPGGGGINVSRAIHNLGGSAVAVYTAGGFAGKLLQHLLDREGIPHHAIPVDGWTRDNLVVYEESTGQQFRFGMPGPTLRDDEWKNCLAELSSIASNAEYIIASGALPSDVPEDFYAQVARLGKKLKAKVVVDTSGEPLRLALSEGVFLIKPNLRELTMLAGHELVDESQQERLAGKIVDDGQSEVVVISRGAGGVLAVWKEGHEHVRAPTVPIKSKVGAGDSMVAGIVLSLARGRALPEAVRFGIAAGTAAVMTPGTELCRRDDTERLYAMMSAAVESSRQHRHPARH